MKKGKTALSPWARRKLIGDRVEEDLLTRSIDSEGAQTQFSRTPSSRVTSPLGTASVLELSSRQRVHAWALEHQRLMRSRVSRRLEPHLAMERTRSSSCSTSGGSHLARGQVEIQILLVRCQERDSW
jgi:hypothetical protein